MNLLAEGFGFSGPLKLLVLAVLHHADAGLRGFICVVVKNSYARSHNTNLKPCPDCDRLVSIHTPNYPNCRRPFEQS